MKVNIKLKELTEASTPSFTTKYYDVLIKGQLVNTLTHQNDDFSNVLPATFSLTQNSEERLSNPDFDFIKFAVNHKKATLLLTFIPCDQDCDMVTQMWADKFSILIHKGKAFLVPVEPSSLDLNEIILSK